MKQSSINLFITAALLLCGNKMILAAELTNDSQIIINQFQKELKTRLSDAIEHGGPVNAISVCASEAPLIASRLSRQNGVKLQRLSSRYRNPLNMPTPEQQEIIHYLETNPYGADSYFKELGGGESIFAKAIRMEGVCLTCHGQSVSEPVLASLRTNYPYDTATAYKLGDFRGIFSVQWDRPNSNSLAIKNFRMMSKNLWVGGQPSELQILDLKNRGITKIINLRPEGEMDFDEAALASKAGIDYANIPIAGSGDVTLKNSKKLRSLIDQSKGPVFLHCASSNRVGALLALDANKQGLAVDSSLNLGRAAGLTSLAEAVNTSLENNSNIKSDQ